LEHPNIYGVPNLDPKNFIFLKNDTTIYESTVGIWIIRLKIIYLSLYFFL